MDDELNTGDIGVGIKSKNVQGGRVILTLSQFRSSLDPLDTNEILHVLHSLTKSKYTEITAGQSGFSYTFPLIFGE